MSGQSNILLESGTNELEIVEFVIEEVAKKDSDYVGYYGVNVAKVLEIIRMPDVTDMPDKPHPSVLGAFNLRSNIIPLVDLSVWLGKEMAPTDAAKVIVTEFNSVMNAFVVSGVNRIHRISWSDVEPPSPQLSAYSGGTITGVVKMDGRIVFILDMERIVAELNPNLGMNIDVTPLPEEEAEITHKILISDDSSMILKTMTRGLEDAGFDVLPTRNGREAWEGLLDIKKQSEDEGKPINEYLHAVISDIEMPVMDGHNLTKRIKEDPVLSKLPVILFSSLITDRLRHKGESVGADEQISKPGIQTLADTVSKLIGERWG